MGQKRKRKAAKPVLPESPCKLLGERVPDGEARERWPHRYLKNDKRKNSLKVGSTSLISRNSDEEEVLQASYHYRQAEVDGRVIFNLHDNAYVQAEEGHDYHICKIVEFFVTVKGLKYFRAQWFYRARDTVIGNHEELIDQKRVFLSDIQDDNPLDCLVQKLKIILVSGDIKVKKENPPLDCDFYCDMKYLLPYTTFINLPADVASASSDSLSTISSDTGGEIVEENSSAFEDRDAHGPQECTMTVLDLYSGCGAMSTGLCAGAKISGLNLVTRWAVDINEHACESIRLNHPETEVRNESAEDFLLLLKEWQKLCAKHLQEPCVDLFVSEDVTAEDNEDEIEEDDSEVFEVQKFLAICYGNPEGKKPRGLYFQVRWKGYGPSKDSWEPLENLGNCTESLREFVERTYESKAIPLPGDIDLICGGPPCQGMSGLNRHRNKENPFGDIKNYQVLVFMNIVEFLKPKFVLMENVVDILKFASGSLGRFAIGRLIQMNYQARMGIVAAGAYGLPQFRQRFFVWGALPTERLPPYPLPTHDVILRGQIPRKFQAILVAYDEGHSIELNKKLFLEDAISDLPPVSNDELRDAICYEEAPKTEFQRIIRLRMCGEPCNILYDHRSEKLNVDDYERVCRIPKRKGANFRDWHGVRVRPDNTVELDPDVEREFLPSKKPMVPRYTLTFEGGRSLKPFGRLWWDETVSTVVTRAQPHNLIILHPEQDRVLTVRENARLQGFPDYYRFCGPIPERYKLVGNAVAMPAGRALGYAFGRSCQGLVGDEPLVSLPPSFPSI